MSLEQVLLERLNTDSDITNIVGDRIIRGGTAQDTALPFLAYQISAAESVQALDGGTSLTNYTVEIAVASQTYSEARNILDAVRARIDNSTWDGVQGSFFSE